MTNKSISIVLITLLILGSFVSFVSSAGPVLDNLRTSDNSKDVIPKVIFIPGDVNNDGVVDDNDVRYLINYLFIDFDPAPNPIESGDLDNDGIIGIADLTLLIDLVYRTGDFFIPGDVNRDGKVDEADVDYLVNYLFIDLKPSPNPFLSGDLDNTGTVDIADLTILIDIVFLSSDKDAPTIELIDPNDDDRFRTTKDEREIDFRFRVNDASTILSCNLIIGGDIEKTLRNVERNVINTFSVDLDSDEKYTWSVRCLDSFGNEGESENRNFELDKRKSSSTNKNNNNNFVDLDADDDDDKSRVRPPLDLRDRDTDTIEAEGKVFNLPILIPLIILISINILIVFLIIVVRSRRINY